MKKAFLEAGRVVGTHGVRGEMRVECWCNSPAFLSKFKTLYLDGGTTQLKVTCRAHKNIALMKVKGIDTLEEAETWRGKILFIDRADVRLSEGEHFVQDLIGLEVVDEKTNDVFGVISDVLKTGSNDVYEMKDENGKRFYIPVIDDVVKKVDVDGGVVKIFPMKGLFDDED